MDGFWYTFLSGINLANLAQAGGVLYASWAIVTGIDAWKREFIGKRRIELAESTLAKFFEVKDAIAFIRSPFSKNDEGSTRQRSERETAQESEILDRGYVVVERYQKRERAFEEFNVLKYKFMASFGASHEKVFTDTMTSVNSIFSAATMLAHHYWGNRNMAVLQGDAYQRHIDEMQKFERVIWDTGDSEDKIRVKLADIQSRLDEATKPCFVEQASSYALLTKKWKWPWR
jgi:hypothetical protein